MRVKALSTVLLPPAYCLLLSRIPFHRQLTADDLLADFVNMVNDRLGQHLLFGLKGDIDGPAF